MRIVLPLTAVMSTAGLSGFAYILGALYALAALIWIWENPGTFATGCMTAVLVLLLWIRPTRTTAAALAMLPAAFAGLFWLTIPSFFVGYYYARHLGQAEEHAPEFWLRFFLRCLLAFCVISVMMYSPPKDPNVVIRSFNSALTYAGPELKKAFYVGLAAAIAAIFAQRWRRDRAVQASSAHRVASLILLPLGMLMILFHWGLMVPWVWL